jgi:SsrA-binding protein
MSTLASNDAAGFHYDLQDRYEAGIQLTGPEVRAAKRGDISLKGSYITIDPKGAWLVGARIAPYKPARSVQVNYDPTRNRRLLLSGKELGELIGKSSSQGLTVIPISFYTKGGLVKVEMAVARGKRKIDKREAIKRREVDRRINRAMKSRTR